MKNEIENQTIIINKLKRELQEEEIKLKFLQNAPNNSMKDDEKEKIEMYSKITELENQLTALRREYILKFSIPPLKDLVKHMSGEYIYAFQNKSRKSDVILHKHAMFYFLTKNTNYQIHKIGSKMGGYDHSTVIHGRDRFANYLEIGDELAIKKLQEIEEIFLTLKN